MSGLPAESASVTRTSTAPGSVTWLNGMAGPVTAVLLTVINFVNYLDRMVVVTMYDDLRRVFQLSNGQLGALSAGFYVVHALATVPFGWASDRYDRRRVIAVGVLSWSLA